MTPRRPCLPPPPTPNPPKKQKQLIHLHPHPQKKNSIATNAVIPIAFSFLGDLYPPDNRSLPSTLVTAAMGVGA